MVQATARALRETRRVVPALADLQAFDDVRLVQSYLSGDERAFTVMVDRYQVRLLNFVYRIVGDRERADALRQAGVVFPSGRVPANLELRERAVAAADRTQRELTWAPLEDVLFGEHQVEFAGGASNAGREPSAARTSFVSVIISETPTTEAFTVDIVISE